MFSFGIYLDEPHPDGDSLGQEAFVGEIVLGCHQETVHAASNYWTASAYRRQWLQALNRLETEASSALITSISSVAPDDVLFWWPMYRFGQTVLVHNQMLVLSQCPEGFELARWWDYVSPYERFSDEGTPLSEWSVAWVHVDRFRRELIETMDST